MQLFATKEQKFLQCPRTKRQQNRSFSNVPGQRDNRTSSKSCTGTGRAGTACQNPESEAGLDNHYVSVNIQDRTPDWPILFFPMISCFRTSFPFLERTFPVLEHLFPVFFWFLWERDFVPGFLLLPLSLLHST